jgi:hypothetical protein
MAFHDARNIAEDFFIQCHSFKDWLIHDHPQLKKAVEQHINATPELALAADYANMQKHSAISNPRSQHRIEKVNVHNKIDLTPERDAFLSSATFTVTLANGRGLNGLALPSRA